MPGTLYLIPNTLGPTEALPGALSHVIPAHVQAVTASLDYFVAENAKTARALAQARRSAVASGASPASGDSSMSGAITSNGRRRRLSSSRR